MCEGDLGGVGRFVVDHRVDEFAVLAGGAAEVLGAVHRSNTGREVEKSLLTKVSSRRLFPDAAVIKSWNSSLALARSASTVASSVVISSRCASIAARWVVVAFWAARRAAWDSSAARVPAIVVPAVEGRTDRATVPEQAGTWGSILPAVWSFMLAARARGLGTVWTTAQGPLEHELAGVLGVPYREVMLAALIPLAFTVGTDFRPAKRVDRDQVLHWNTW